MDNKLISVVVPAYNAEQYITEAIESILAQTYHPIEIVVVDDGSTDTTAFITRQFGDSVRYIYQSNRGLAAARNTGIRNSQAEIIALLDADDLWEPEFLELMVDLLRQHPNAAAAYCGFQYIDEKGCAVGEPSLKVLPPESFHESLCTNGNWLSACGVIFRKQQAEEVGLFDESLRAVEDEDLWIRLSARWPFVGLPKALVKYRRHDSNMSSDPERMITAILQVREKVFGPPDGDERTWPVSKRRAYQNVYQLAAIRYLGIGQVQKCAGFIWRLVGISWDCVYSMSLWRGLARAHLPEVVQFNSLVQLDWSVAETQIKALLNELSTRIPDTGVLHSRFTRCKSSAFLALADEAGRGRRLDRALLWLGRAAFTYPKIFLTRPYWGTVARSFFHRKHVQPVSSLS